MIADDVSFRVCGLLLLCCDSERLAWFLLIAAASAFHGRATPRATGRRRHSRLRARRFTRRRAQHQRAVSCNQSTCTGQRAARESYQFYNCSSRVLPFNVSSRLCLRHVDKYNKYSGTSSPPSSTRANATSIRPGGPPPSSTCAPIRPGGQLAIPFKFGQPAFGANYDDSRSTADRATTAGDLSDTGRDRSLSVRCQRLQQSPRAARHIIYCNSTAGTRASADESERCDRRVVWVYACHRLCRYATGFDRPNAARRCERAARSSAAAARAAQPASGRFATARATSRESGCFPIWIDGAPPAHRRPITCIWKCAIVSAAASNSRAARPPQFQPQCAHPWARFRVQARRQLCTTEHEFC